MSIADLVDRYGFMRLGAYGPHIREMQLALAALGYDLKGTGYFGSATDTAVSDFQVRVGLEADGIVGPLTAEAIDAAVPPDPVDAVAIGRPLWLVEAYHWLGEDEVSGAKNNPEIMKWAKDEGGAIAKTYNADSIPWCALFTNMTLTKAGHKGTETLWALDFNSDSKWPNVKLSGAAVGAIIPMQRSGGGHVATVCGRTSNGYLAAIGGNQSDSVTVAAFPVDRPKSYRWPLGAQLPALVGFKSLPLVNSAGVPISKDEA